VVGWVDLEILMQASVAVVQVRAVIRGPVARAALPLMQRDPQVQGALGVEAQAMVMAVGWAYWVRGLVERVA